ncbi:hypothetical protein D4764_0142810 [Takifugu flavidus]|uniref:Uncharacterized protein n=1 Tax=Takifugu flavidus TaxID=433684 RepID=A0A5C6MM31_9TELE|nr:hypothetical protein D4764_0142810 [Takifugu flavidus]
MKATHALQRATRAALKSRMRLSSRGLPTPAVDFPVVGDTDLTLASEQYLSSLEQIPHKTKEFQSSTTNKTTITVNNVTRLQLFEDGGADCTLLALHPSGDPTQVFFPLQVQSIVERVIVFLLSRDVDRSLDETVCFSLHPRTESCSLLWGESGDRLLHGQTQRCDGGSLWDTWSGQGYLLPGFGHAWFKA